MIFSSSRLFIGWTQRRLATPRYRNTLCGWKASSFFFFFFSLSPLFFFRISWKRRDCVFQLSDKVVDGEGWWTAYGCASTTQLSQRRCQRSGKSGRCWALPVVPTQWLSWHVLILTIIFTFLLYFYTMTDIHRSNLHQIQIAAFNRMFKCQLINGDNHDRPNWKLILHEGNREYETFISGLKSVHFQCAIFIGMIVKWGPLTPLEVKQVTYMKLLTRDVTTSQRVN